MNLPKFGRGLELVSAQFNKLSDAIRRSTITSVIGGTMTVTPGGTTLIIDAQPRGGGGGGAVVNCPFEVTNASTDTEIKVEVKQGMIANRWPDGMGIDNPPFLLTLSKTASSYIYAIIEWNTTTMTISTAAGAITIGDFTTLKTNSTHTEYILIATVKVELEKIKEITNVCAQPAPNACNLDWGTP